LVQNNGAAAGQTVSHFHVHIIPRYEDGPNIVTWEPRTASAEELNQVRACIQAAIKL
ncbi:MAG: HIT family protein, partial [Clostridium sp.]